MIGRNRELRRASACALAVSLLGAAAAWAQGGWLAAVILLVTMQFVTLAFLTAERQRYKKIARLTERVDEVLHGERDVDFERMSEGELAILASELDKMRVRLLLSNEELGAEKNALADSLADVSHQIKTPLTALGLMTVNLRSRLFAEGAHDDEVARLREMERLEDRVKWLVQALLKLARIDAGTVKLAQARVEASELAARASEPLAVAFDLADVELAVSVEPGAGFEGDLAWTAEALENVLKNCLEHAPAGSRVELSATEDALACRIRVRDHGPGFSEDDLPHVFDRFYRAEGGSEVDPAGVGIGLALAQSLIAAQGGSIRASNAAGGGAQFDIAFFKAVV